MISLIDGVHHSKDVLNTTLESIHYSHYLIFNW